MSEQTGFTPSYAGRRSDRVELPDGIGPGQSRIGADKAPESMTASASFAVATLPEGRGSSIASTAAPRSPVRRTSQEQLRSLRASLTSRDWLVLASFEDHPYLTTGQLQRLHFADHATAEASARVCRRVLRRLAAGHVIEHLERRVGGVRAGSASFVWRLGPVGDRLLRERSGDSGRARRREPSLRFLDHCLLAAEAHLQLLEAGLRGELDVLRVDTEPRCWRPYLAPGPVRSVLKPDLFAATAVPGSDYEDHWFIEIDRATESQPTLLRKCARYDQYRRSGLEQQRHGVFPLTLWVMPDEQRIARLRQSLKATRTTDASLHRMTTLPGLIAAVTRGPA